MTQAQIVDRFYATPDIGSKLVPYNWLSALFQLLHVAQAVFLTWAQQKHGEFTSGRKKKGYEHVATLMVLLAIVVRVGVSWLASVLWLGMGLARIVADFDPRLHPSGALQLAAFFAPIDYKKRF